MATPFPGAHGPGWGGPPPAGRPFGGRDANGVRWAPTLVVSGVVGVLGIPVLPFVVAFYPFAILLVLLFTALATAALLARRPSSALTSVAFGTGLVPLVSATPILLAYVVLGG